MKIFQTENKTFKILQNKILGFKIFIRNLIRGNIKQFPLPEYKTDYLHAPLVNILKHKITISSVHCPPKYNIN